LEIDSDELDPSIPAFIPDIRQGFGAEAEVDHQIGPLVQEDVRVLDGRVESTLRLPDRQRQVVMLRDAFQEAVVDFLYEVSPISVDQESYPACGLA